MALLPKRRRFQIYSGTLKKFSARIIARSARCKQCNIQASIRPSFKWEPPCPSKHRPCQPPGNTRFTEALCEAAELRRTQAKRGRPTKSPAGQGGFGGDQMEFKL